MALPASDTFTQSADSTLTTYSANWAVNYGTWNVGNNACWYNAGTDGFCRWSADSFANDQYSQATIVLGGNSRYIGVAARMAGGTTRTGYAFYGSDGDASYLFKIVAATETTLGSAGNVPANGDVFRIECSGTSIRPMRNGSTDGIGVQTDSSIASGSAGLAAWGTNNNTGDRLDNWSGGNLSTTPLPSVSDAVTTGETVTIAVGGPKPSVSDAVTVGEAVTVSLPAGTPLPSVSDAVTVGETVSASVGAPKPSVSDAVAAAEAVTVAVGTPRPSVTDAVTTGEAVTVAVGTPAPSVTDAITTGESVTVTVTPLAARSVSVSDAVTTGETVTVTPLVLADVSVTDSITVGESVNVSVGVAGARQVSVSESVTVSDAPTVSMSALTVSVSDSATVTDSPTAYFGFTVSVTDAVAVTDTPAVGMTRRINVSDAATVGETVTARSTLYVSVTDAISTTDTVSFTPLLVYVSVTDGVTLAETVGASFAAPITAWVTLTLNDRPQSFVLPARDDIYVLHARTVTLETEDR